MLLKQSMLRGMVTHEGNCVQGSRLNIDVAPHRNFAFHIKYGVLNLNREPFANQLERKHSIQVN